MAATKDNLQTLDNLYKTIMSLEPTSPPSEFEKFATFFTEDCKTWLQGMREHATPAVGRQATIEKLKKIMGDRYWRVDDRRVLSTATTDNPDGSSKVFCETDKRLILHGEVLDPFFETEVVDFTPDGLIKELKLYCCWSPIASLIQDITGVGPYQR